VFIKLLTPLTKQALAVTLTVTQTASARHFPVTVRLDSGPTGHGTAHEVHQAAGPSPSFLFLALFSKDFLKYAPDGKILENGPRA
jgi:hypothetical protein